MQSGKQRDSFETLQAAEPTANISTAIALAMLCRISTATQTTSKSLTRVGTLFRGELLVGPTSVQLATFSCLEGDAQLSALNRGVNDWVYADNFIHITKATGQKPEDVQQDWKQLKDPRMSTFSPQLRTFNELTVQI
jgi:hypothetical protein